MTGKRGQKTSFKTTLPGEFTEGFLSRLDARSAVARELNRRVQAIESDLGGADILTYGQRSLIRRVVFLEAHIQKTEVALASGRKADITTYLNAIGTLKSLWTALGLRRAPKSVPDLGTYLEATYGEDTNTD